jgi:1-acyl-sn-glycerol-3-phosphate acyltransferase
MILARSLIFVGLFYLWSIAVGLAALPLLLAPRRWMVGVIRTWARGVILLLRACCGISVELRGRQNLPVGRALVAAKHQCMFDVFAQFAWLSDPCFTMKRELAWIPVFSAFAAKLGTLTLNREGKAAALRKMLKQARQRLCEERQLVIFPEGTRGEPGRAGYYRPGVAGLYRDLDIAVCPVATNSGLHWPAHGVLRRPGTIVFEYLEPIPPGLERRAFMRLLEDRIEAASNALLPL